MELQTLERWQFSHESFHSSRYTAITTDVFISPFPEFITATSSTDQETWKFLQLSDRFCIIGDVPYDTSLYPTAIYLPRQFGCFFRYRRRRANQSL